MLELIRHCHCGESCPVKFRLCKCITCDQVEVSQAHEHPDNMEKNQVYEREIRGIQDQVKKIIEYYFTKNFRPVRSIDIFN